jgi:Fur family iron response transcriptional regulator
VAEILRENAIPLTLQRLAIAQILLTRPVHLTADQVLTKAQEIIPEISRATVYNTLNLLQKKGLLCELDVAPGRVIYDSNMQHHYHIYNVDTGKITDVAEGELKVVGTPALPEGVVLENVDIILRVHSVNR